MRKKILYEIVEEYFDKNSIPKSNINGKSYIVAAIDGYRRAGMSSGGYSKFIKKYFPHKYNGTKLAYYILSELDLKYCSSCDLVRENKLFSRNSSKLDGLASYCKSCQKNHELPTAAERSAKYKASKLCATPSWVNREELRLIYENCPKGFHVDHIVPLNGYKIKGLHVPWNLQYLPAIDNLKKSNSFDS